MKLKGGQQYQFNQLKEDIQKELSRNSFPTTIFNTVNHISQVINTIRLTKGHGWAAKVINANGQPVFTPIEQQRYTELFKPHISSIIAFFDDKEEVPSHMVVQQGGQSLTIPTPESVAKATLPTVALPTPESVVATALPVALPTALPSAESVAATLPTAALPTAALPTAALPTATNPVQPKKSKGKLSGYSDKAAGAAMDALSKFDISEITPDVLFDNIMNKLTSINNTINKSAEPVNLTHDLDEKPDVPVGQTGIFISPRLIVFLIYYVLDVTRIAIGVSGNETGRKLLSVIVSILELVRGDWKKAMLTFIGYFGMSPMLFGTVLKVYLTVIQMLSPTLQIKLPYFMYDSAKSIIFGIILSVIQLGAPKPIRDQINSVLEKLSNVQRDLDTKLQNLNPPLTARPDYFKADFSDLNNLQSILDDPVYVCSAEHRKAVDDLVASVGKEGAPAVQLVLSLMRYPHTPGMTKYLCDSKAKKSYVNLLVEEGLQREQKEIAETAETAETAINAAEKATVAAEKAETVPTKGGRRRLRKSNYYK